jgi:ADP-ribosyl-[dinitrogen reductase] hydrolase
VLARFPAPALSRSFILNLHVLVHVTRLARYNNAFRDGGSVGLGGNIGASLYSMREGVLPEPTFATGSEDAGNGSLMRLAPIPVYFWRDASAARAMAAKASYTTHPGPLAADACEVLAFLVAQAIEELPIFTTPASAAAGDSVAGVGGLKAWMDAKVAELEALLLAERGTDFATAPLLRLLRASEPPGSTEECWNWRANQLPVEAALAARGASYNGYPVSPGYFGAFSFDGLAMALHSVYHTSSFDAAVVRCVNFLGDADSTGSMVGQLAGALYGWSTIDPRFLANLARWDDHHTALRGWLLYSLGPSAAQPSSAATATASA